MIDPDDRERAALAHAMKSMGLLMGEIGWTVSFKDLTAAQAESLAEAAVDGFQEGMRALGSPESSEVPF